MCAPPPLPPPSSVRVQPVVSPPRLQPHKIVTTCKQNNRAASVPNVKFHQQVQL